MLKRLFFVFLLVLINNNINAQNVKPWNGKKCTVVLTYDDGMRQHLDNAIPALDSEGLKATFYLTAFNSTSKNRVAEWRKAAANGHELGNHTIYHPCDGSLAGREWVSKENDLSNYSIQRMQNEILMCNTYLNAIDGNTKRTFAFTCGDMKIRDTSFYEGIKNEFIAARAVRAEMHSIDSIDLNNVDCYYVNNNTAEQMIEWVNTAKEKNALLVILFHGVGGGHAFDITLQEHRKFLKFLKENQDDIWVTSMLEAAEYIKKYQSSTGK